MDFVKNPSKIPDLDGIHARLDEDAKNLVGNDETIRKLVFYYVFEAASSDDAWNEKQLISRLEPHTYPIATEMLSDVTLHDQLNQFDPEAGLVGEAPIHRLLHIFDPYKKAPDSIIPLLQPFLESDHSRVRSNVSYTICSIGNSKVRETLQKANRDSDDEVLKWALMGFRFATSEDRVPIEDRDLLYDTILEFWSGENYPAPDEVPQALCYLSPDRAAEFLTSPKVFDEKHTDNHYILEALKMYRIDFPRTKLLKLISEYQKKSKLSYTASRSLGESLESLGAHRNPEDLPILETFLDSEEDKVVEGAAAGLYRFHDFFENIRDPWEVEQDEGWEALTDVEKHICAIQMLNSEVVNGGFTQYYFNSSGNNWEDARDGLKAVGSIELLAILNETIAKFPDHTPSTSRKKRSDQLAKIVKKDDSAFNDESSRWYKATESLEKLLVLYNLANKSGRGKKDD